MNAKNLKGIFMLYEKVGRNDACPCGSGKKYKKCCIEKTLVPEELADTKLGDFLDLFAMIAKYGAFIMREEEFHDVLTGCYEEIERDFRPGQPGGLHESFCMNWFFLDFRFGTYQKTIAERFTESIHYKSLNSDERYLLSRLTNSYATCFEVKEVQREFIIFKELVTKKTWKMIITGEPYQKDAHESDIWFCRLVGTMDEAWCFGDPYIFSKEAKKDFLEILKMNIDGFKEYMKTRSLSFDPIRDGSKAASMFWAEYLYRSNNPNREHEARFKEESVRQPHMVTTDKEKIIFCSVYFKISEKEGLREKIDNLPCVDYDAQNKTWIWFKKGNKTLSGNTILGSIEIKGEYLVGQANSLERALRLKSKLSKGLGSRVEYEKVEGKDLASLPPLSAEDEKKFAEEQKKIDDDPVLNKFIRQHLEDYYLKEWIVTKIPALNNKTPLQTVKTEEGRLRLEALINRMEKMGENMPDETHFDMDLLRKKLGLPHQNSDKKCF
ncbi:MAG: SEC-C domain-containing protein [Candidatus Omnitrophica bacterium]|nr:SEC-C domain-containing protein [Candidatus Omnitrophota bacterium]